MSRPPVLAIEAHRGQGGPPTTLLHLAGELAQRRPLAVAIPPGPVAARLRAADDGTRVVELPRWRPAGRPITRVASLPVLVRAVREMPAGGVIHANGASALNLVGPILVMSKRRALVHFHSYELHPRTARTLRMWHRAGAEVRYAPVSEMARSVLHLAGLGRWAVDTVPNPVLPLDAPPRPPADGPVEVAFYSSRDERKGLDLMIEVADRLRHLDVCWTVYGLGPRALELPYVRRCREDAAARGLDAGITWMGWQPDFAARVAGAHALLVTSRRESFCRVALEAMEAGTPVVAGRIDGLTEAVGTGNCRLFDLEDLGAGAAALEEVLCRPHVAEELAAQGRRRAREFHPDRVVDRLEAIYEEMGSSS